MRLFNRWLEKAVGPDQPVDIRRRGFIFGAAATALVVAAPKSFFILEPPKIILPPPLLDAAKLQLDLPLQQMMALMKKLEEQALSVSAIPRWVVLNKDYYDSMVPMDHEAEARRLVRRDANRRDRMKWEQEQRS